MDYQVLFNIALGVAAVVIGWLWNDSRSQQKDLARKLEESVKSHNELAVSIPENYVHKNDLRDLATELFKKLDRISDKLDQKADKT